jgi:hypothetical protein
MSPGLDHHVAGTVIYPYQIVTRENGLQVAGEAG